MNKLPPLKKIIASHAINTETSRCLHVTSAVISVMKDDQVHCINSAHALYVNENEYFIAYWNQPTWNHALLRQEYTEGIELVSHEQARQWLQNACPEKLTELASVLEKNRALLHTVSVRMDADMRSVLECASIKLGISISRTCVSLMESGIATAKAKAKFHLPGALELKMPDGSLALNEHGQANRFNDSDDQYLAGRAAGLLFLVLQDYEEVLPFVARSLSYLQTLKDCEQRVICFSHWVAMLHK